MLCLIEIGLVWRRSQKCEKFTDRQTIRKADMNVSPQVRLKLALTKESLKNCLVYTWLFQIQTSKCQFFLAPHWGSFIHTYHTVLVWRYMGTRSIVVWWQHWRIRGPCLGGWWGSQGIRRSSWQAWGPCWAEGSCPLMGMFLWGVLSY